MPAGHYDLLIPKINIIDMFWRHCLTANVGSLVVPAPALTEAAASLIEPVLKLMSYVRVYIGCDCSADHSSGCSGKTCVVIGRLCNTFSDYYSCRDRLHYREYVYKCSDFYQ